MLSSLYDIVVSPLVCLIELVFTIGYRLTGSPGLAVIGVSLAVNLLCLPLYRMADAAQADDHINASFSGDERVMMLQTYYRLRHYRPSQALIGSLSLLLQIPFFMAAYSYLSGLSIFSGAQFMALTNLGAPDALIHLGGMTANVMPLLMTALNCVSTAVYTRGLPMRDKAQAYGLALVFLVLLYDSPSGLVLYWTLNQIFSLAKNIFMKVVPEPRRWALILAQVASALVAVLLAASGRLHTPKRAIFVGILLVLGLLWTVTEAFYANLKQQKEEKGAMQKRVTNMLRRIDLDTIFFFLGILMAVACLETIGVLELLGRSLDTIFEGNHYLVTGIIGVLSSIVDNVPLVAGCMGMYPMQAAGDMALDGVFWQLLAYCAGVGGSMLIIGSAAGVVVMGLEKISFGWYMKKITWIAFVGYVAGIGCYWLIRNFLW